VMRIANGQIQIDEITKWISGMSGRI